MNILQTLTALLISPLVALGAANPPQSASRPNVLFIAIDDLRTSLGCYGDKLAKFPNIDRLAQTSRLFLGAYTQQAVCGPARTAVLSGRLPDNTRVWHNRNLFRDTLPNAITLPQLFKNNGYQALSFGKVFSGAETEPGRNRHCRSTCLKKWCFLNRQQSASTARPRRLR